MQAPVFTFFNLGEGKKTRHPEKGCRVMAEAVRLYLRIPSSFLAIIAR